MLNTTFSCRYGCCEQTFPTRWRRQHHEQRDHGLQPAHPPQSKRQGKFEILHRMMSVGGFEGKTQFATFVLSCLTAHQILQVMKLVMKGSDTVRLKLTQFLRLPVAIQKMNSFEMEEEKRNYLGDLNISLKLGEEAQQELNEALDLGFSAHQFRKWKGDTLADIGIGPSPGNNGYCAPLQQCIETMMDCDWKEYDKDNPEGILLTVSTDGGSMDRRNGAVIVKLQRRDEKWAIGNRFKKPELNATHSVLYIKEKYETLQPELHPLFDELTHPLVCSDGIRRPIVCGASDDMKMSCLLLGLGKIYLRTSRNMCFRCHAYRHDTLPDKHHFDGALSEEEWKCFEEFASTDQELKISNTCSRTVKRRTLEEIQTVARELDELRRDVCNQVPGAAERLSRRIEETGVEHYPITTIPIHRHFLELIHLTEGITKRVIKLMVVPIPPNSEMEHRVKTAFQHFADISFTETGQGIPLWRRLDKTRLNRVKWLQVLADFFAEGMNVF